MSDSPATGPETERLGGRTLALVALGYAACVVVATFPFALSFGEGLPGSLLDPLQHLWIVRWYKACLLEWRLPVMCPELQYPVGAPLGNFSPLHMQAILYLPLSFVFPDVICFNLIWLTGLVTTGLGTFLLAWHVLRDRRCAAVGGMLAMLSAPVLLHARAHLELIFVGCFPLFLAAWMRFVEAPSRRRLAAATAAYVLVGLCAAYYVAFAAVPAALYAAYAAAGAVRRRDWPWLRSRAAWLAAFAALAAPCLALIFGNQIWAMLRGYAGARTLEEYGRFGTPPWTYGVPSIVHALSGLMPVEIYGASGIGWDGERISYLGVVTLFLAHYAAVVGARFPRRGYWWLTLAALVVLSAGTHWEIAGHRVPLPGLWLKKYVPLFKAIRVPARFNLFVAVAAAVIAAAGLKRLLESAKGPRRRAAVVAGLAALALFDLSTRPFPPAPIPELPAAYEFIRGQDPRAGFVEVPQSGSGGSFLSAVCTYWQSQHRLRTSAGYSGSGNVVYDNRLAYNSPFYAAALRNPDYARDPDEATFDVVGKVNALDYIWLYLHVNDFRFVVLHEWPGSDGGEPVDLGRLKALLEPARVFSRGGVVVYDREKIRPPARAVEVTTTGWRLALFEGRLSRVAGREARIAVYNPEPDRAVKFVLAASAYPRARTVRLLADGAELARWQVARGDVGLHVSPPLRLPAGRREIVLESDGESPPLSARQQPIDGDDRPYSLRVTGLALIDAEEHDRESAPASRLAAGAEGAQTPGEGTRR